MHSVTLNNFRARIAFTSFTTRTLYISFYLKIIIKHQLEPHFGFFIIAASRRHRAKAVFAVACYVMLREQHSNALVIVYQSFSRNEQGVSILFSYKYYHQILPLLTLFSSQSSSFLLLFRFSSDRDRIHVGRSTLI